MTGLTKQTGTIWQGAGRLETVIKLAAGSDTDVIQGAGFTTLTLSGNNTGGISGWGIRDLSIDGNYSAQSGTSYGLRVYGFEFDIARVSIRNCLSWGLYTEWGTYGQPGPDESMESRYEALEIHGNQQGGWHDRGPHDSRSWGATIWGNGSGYPNYWAESSDITPVVASASNGADVSTFTSGSPGTLHVSTTLGFPAASISTTQGAITVVTALGSATLTYTGATAQTFTGCVAHGASAGSTVSTGADVTAVGVYAADGNTHNGIHAYGSTASWQYQLDAAITLDTATSEVAATGMVLIRGWGCQILGGDFFVSGSATGCGIQLGDSVNAVSVTQVSALVRQLANTSSSTASLNIANDYGSNEVRLAVYAPSGTVVTAGTPAAGSVYRVAAFGQGASQNNANSLWQEPGGLSVGGAITAGAGATFGSTALVESVSALFQAVNTGTSQYQGSGATLYSSASSMGTQGGVNMYAGIANSGATQGFFTIDQVNYQGNYAGHLLYFDLNGETATLYYPLTLNTPLAITSGGSGVATTGRFNVRAYGATGNGAYLSTGVMTASSTTLTASSGAWTSADVGKQIIVYGAAASGAHLGTTISAYVSATQVTLAAAATTSVSGAIVVYGTSDGTAIQSAQTAALAAGGALYFPAGIYVTTVGLGAEIGGRVFGDGPGNCGDSQAFASGTSNVSYGSTIVVTPANTSSLVASTSVGMHEFDHLSVIWTASGGKIFAAEGNGLSSIHDCRFEVNDPAGNGQVAASFVESPFTVWERCTFAQLSSTRQLPLYQSIATSSGGEANITFSQCQWMNLGFDYSQYMCDIEFQGATGTGGDGYTMQVAWRDSTFGRPWGGAIRCVGVENPTIENCGFWDLADGGAPAVAMVTNQLMYFGSYSGGSPCRGVRVTGCFKNRAWSDGVHVWDVYCDQYTQGVQVSGFTSRPSSSTSGANIYLNFNGCNDVVMFNNQYPTGDNPGTTSVSNATSAVTLLNGAITTTTPLALPSGGLGTGSLTGYEVLVANAAGTAVTQVPGTGTAGEVVTSNGPGALPTWQPGSGAGVTLDFTAADIEPDATQSAGTGTLAAISTHVHPATTWLPSDNNLLGAVADPYVYRSGQILTAGTVYLVKLPIRLATTITYLWWSVTTIGAGSSAGSFTGLYSSGGSLLTGSSDIGTDLTSLSTYKMTLTTPQSLSAGTFVWAAFLSNLVATQPNLACATAPSSLLNAGLTAASYRVAVNSPAATTVASGSNGGEISAIASWSSPSAGVLAVASVSGYPSSGSIAVAATGSTLAEVTYTGTATGQFTGCAYVSGSATGTVSTGGAVTNAALPATITPSGNSETGAYGFWVGWS